MNHSPKVEKAKAEDFDKILPLLADFNNPNITRELWKNLFNDCWGFQKDYRGYKLVAGEEIVGFIAYILSQKFIDDRWEKICNISSWIVKPEFRNNSIDLLYPLLELRDYTIISFTPTLGAYRVETKLFGFKEFDRHEVIMPALPCLPALVKTKFKIHTAGKSSRHALEQYLSDYEKKVYRDHEKFDCEHVVITSKQGNLYMIFKKTYRRHLPFFKLYYVNTPGLFLQYLEALRFRVPLALGGVGIIVDSRFLQGKHVLFTKKKEFHMPMLYRTERLRPHEVDYLYSEFFLLGF